MALKIEAIVEKFDKKAKARKAEARKPTKPGERGVTSIRMNGGGTYSPALMNQDCSNGTVPERDRLLYS
jgi:hypothetical protein